MLPMGGDSNVCLCRAIPARRLHLPAFFLGALAATLIALGIFIFQIAVSTLWLKYFAYGPMEWIWRQLTYRRRLNLRPGSR